MTEATIEGLRPRPLELIPLVPDRKEVNKLASALVKVGFSKDAARGVAAACVEPATVLALLDNPTEQRVTEAQLQVVRIRAYAARVFADPTNPRIVNDFPFPVAIQPGSDARAPYRPIEAPQAEDREFVVRVDGVNQLAWQLQQAMDATVRRNEPKPPIESQGIMDPPLAVAARIEGISDKPFGAVMVREGSTRISHAHRILGIKSTALISQYSDDRQLSALVYELNQIANSPASDIGELDAARLRVAVVPIDLVVGHRPDSGSVVTLQDAINSKVGQEHLNHKTIWDDSAKDVHLGDLCLEALQARSVIGPDRAAWLAGRLTAQEAREQGLEEYPEDRWAELAWYFTTRSKSVASVLRQSIANQLQHSGQGKGQVRNRADKLPLAVSLAMRARRPNITDRAAERESQLLAEGIGPVVLGKIDWDVSVRSVEDLLAGALKEAEDRKVGPFGAALGVRAVWYLVIHGQIQGRRHDLGKGGDRRSAGELIDTMLASPTAIVQLARVVRDGRAGSQAARVRKTIDDVELSGIGKPVPLTAEAIKQELAPQDGPVTPEPQSPFDEYMDALAMFAAAVQKAAHADEYLRDIDDGSGAPMVKTMGIDSDRSEELRGTLNQLLEHVLQYELDGRVAAAVKAANVDG